MVDDDKNLLEMLQNFIEGLGCDVYTGYDGQAAWTMAKSRRPDLIVMDVDMPFMNGIDALNLIRKEEQCRATPVILLTGMLSAEVYPNIATTPKVSHIKKPVSLEDLGSLVRHYLPQLVS